MSASRRAVIIGGGITGTLTAWSLARAGWQVTLLEAAHLGAGSSSRTAAGIRQQFSTVATVRGMRHAVAFYREMGERTGTMPIVQNGYLFVVADDEGWAAARARVGIQHEAGLREVEALPADEVVRRFPWVGREGLRGATWCPTDGFLLPDVVYGEAARLAEEHGATVLQHAPVVGARVAGERIVSVTTPKGEHEADLFVDCTNIWTRRLAAILGAEPLPVDPLKRYLWFLKREGSLDPDALMRMPLVVCPSGAYVRPENPDTLLLGKKHDADPEPDFDYDDQDEIAPAFSHRTGIDAVPFEVWAEVAEALPPIGEFGGVVATTAGYYGTTPDHNPFFGYDRQRPNLIRLVGFSGHGAMFGPFTARVATELAEAEGDLVEIRVDGEPISLAAFRIGRDYADSELMVI